MGSNKEAMIAKLGSEEAYLEYMRKNGSKGGSRKVPKGFNKWPPAKLRAVGRKGGLRRKREAN